MSVDDTIDGFLSVEEGTQYEFDWSISAVGLFHKSINKVIVMFFEIQGISSKDVAGVQFRQEVKSSSIVGVEVGIADLSVHGIITQKEVDAVNVFACFRVFVLFGVVFLIVFLEGVIEGSAYVHYFA